MRRFNAVIVALLSAMAVGMSACTPYPTLDVPPASEAETKSVVAALQDIEIGEAVTLHFVTGESASGTLESWGYVSIVLSRMTSSGFEQYRKISASYETRYVCGVEVQTRQMSHRPRH